MKKITLLGYVFILLAGCTALSHPERAAQTVVIKDYKQKILWTSCSGAVEDWPNCLDRAKNTCQNGYNTLSRNDSFGGIRELTFQCK